MFAEELSRQRATVKARLTAFQFFLKKLESDPSKSRDLPLRLEQTENLLSEYEIIQHDIETISGFNLDERTKFEDNYYTVITIAIEMVPRLSLSTSSAALTAATGSMINGSRFAILLKPSSILIRI